jgi:hypothetical protein
MWGPGIVTYYGSQHYIIICDKSVCLNIFISELRTRDSASEILIITRDLISFDSQEYPFNKITVMKIHLFDSEVFDRSKPNEAHAIFVFSNKSLVECVQKEKVVEYILLKFLQNQSDMQTPILIQSLYGLSKTAKAMRQTPVLLIKSIIESKSTFLPGFSTFIQNLLLNTYPLSSKIEALPFLIKQYILGCEYQIIISDLSEYFKGKKFKSCIHPIYMESISDYDIKIETDSIEFNRPILLIGLFDSRKVG